MTRRSKPTETVRVRPVLGVDVGGVLGARVAEDSDKSFFGSRPMDTPAVPVRWSRSPRLHAPSGDIERHQVPAR